MTDLSPALLADLTFAVSRWGLTLEDIPRDHEGKTITDRLTMLLCDGESYCHGEFRRTDLRSEHANVWELFPENPATAAELDRTTDLVGELLEQELNYRMSSAARGSEMPRPAHGEVLQGLLAYIDGVGDLPEADPDMWVDGSLFEEAGVVIPGLRAAEVAAITREQLVAELASGAVPAASAVYVQRALDSDMDGLRNADIVLAGYRVSAARLRDAAVRTFEALAPHIDVAERVRQARADIEALEDALHWPGPWRTAPRLPQPAAL